MTEKERARLEEAATTLVEGIWKYYGKTGVIALYTGKTPQDDFDFRAMPECEAEGIVLQTWTPGDLEDLAGITENCNEEDKKTGIAIICDAIEQSLDDGDFDQKIGETFWMP